MTPLQKLKAAENTEKKRDQNAKSAKKSHQFWRILKKAQ
jgi:hypothetical protein